MQKKEKKSISHGELLILQNKIYSWIFQIAAASRIQGITPSTIVRLLRHVKRRNLRTQQAVDC